jgi:iron complex outermembrane receptor protein
LRSAIAAAALSMAAPTVLAQSASPAAAVDADSRRAFDIGAGPLDVALDEFARRSGTNLAFDAALVRGASTHGASGNFTAGEALQMLLSGSGIEALPQAGGYALRKIATGAGADTVLRPVTVLGARDAEPLSTVPAAISVVSRERVQAELTTSNRIEDVITRTAPGFNPTNNGVRQIRGRTAQVFINGVPQNESLRASAGADITLLAPDQVGGIEVARGANSAYGFGSPGGIIALSTPRAESEKLVLKSKLATSANTDHIDDSWQTSFYQSAAQIIGNFDYHVGFSARRDGLVYDPDGERALDFSSPLGLSNSSEDFFDLDTSFGYDFGRAGSVRFAGTYGKADVREGYDSDYSGIYREQEALVVRRPAADSNSRRNYTVNLSYENADLLAHAVKLELLRSRVKTRAYDAFDGVSFLDEQTNEYWGVRSSANIALDRFAQGSSLTYGVDWMRNRYYRPYYNLDTGLVDTYFAPDVSQDSLSPYLQGQLPLGNWHLSAGVRHERYSGHIDSAVANDGVTEGGDIDSFSLTLFNVGAVYTLAAERELYATFSQGAEITQLGRAARDARDADDVHPRPAKSDQYEIGLRQHGEPLDYSLAAFYTTSDLMSALVCDGLTPCTPLREPRDFWGVEGTLNWRAGAQWSLGGTLAWLEGLRETESGASRRISSRDTPPLLIGAYAEYAPTSHWRNRLQLDYRAGRDPFGDSVEYGEGRVDSVFLAHISSTVDVGPGELALGIRNLFNHRYFAVAVQSDNTGYYWIPEQGRRVSLSYTVNW